MTTPDTLALVVLMWCLTTAAFFAGLMAMVAVMVQVRRAGEKDKGGENEA